MPVIRFYEVNETVTTPGTFPELTEVEGVIFDYISEQDAASQRGAFRIARGEGYSQGETARAITSLVNRSILIKRDLTVETDEVPE